MRKKTIVPNDFRDFLSIISLIGMLAIFFRFSLNWAWLDENLTAFFLVVIGASLVVIGNLFTLRRWIKDGIQGGEIVKIFTIIAGLFSMIIGLILMIGSQIPSGFSGFVGLIGLFSAVIIFIDYLKKNN